MRCAGLGEGRLGVVCKLTCGYEVDEHEPLQEIVHGLEERPTSRPHQLVRAGGEDEGVPSEDGEGAEVCVESGWDAGVSEAGVWAVCGAFGADVRG